MGEKVYYAVVYNRDKNKRCSDLIQGFGETEQAVREWFVQEGFSPIYDFYEKGEWIGEVKELRCLKLKAKVAS